MRISVSAIEILVGLCSAVTLMLSMHSGLNAFLIRRPKHLNESVEESVAVCIPARNEQDQIVFCVESVLANKGIVDLRVVVLDDGSSDRTGTLVAQLASKDSRVMLIRGGDGPIPTGWIGKPWACERLRESARGAAILVFVDADVRLASNAITAGVALLREHNLALVSPYPKQLTGSVAERLVQPLLQWLWMTFLPLRMAERTRPISMTAANGQFMILDAVALESIGGFAKVAGEVLDDVGLARALKRNGNRAIVTEGSALATCRMYEGWESLRDGYTKNLWSATGSVAGAVGVGMMFVALYLIPLAGLLTGLVVGSLSLVGVGLLGYLGAVIGRLVTARTTGGSLRDAFLHPLSIVVLLVLIGRSWREHSRGTIRWKGRSI